METLNQPEEKKEEPPTPEQKPQEAPPTQATPEKPQESPHETIINYMKTIDTKDAITINDKIKKILQALKEKGYWDYGKKLPFEIKNKLAEITGAKNLYSIDYAMKQLQKEALKRPKPKEPTEKFGLEIGGQPKEVKEKPPEEKTEEIKEEKQITTLQLSQDDFKALLTNINNTAKTMLKLENDIYPPDLINLLAFLDAKLFSNINVETQNITVNYNIILISAIALHLLPIIPILFTKPKPEEKKEAEQK
jgi:hypothetical protein